jgi:hypothetical protein
MINLGNLASGFKALPVTHVKIYAATRKNEILTNFDQTCPRQTEGKNMQITSLGLRSLQMNPQSETCHATICVQGRSKSVVVECCVPWKKETPDRRLYSALRRETLRQLMRMPEYRSGKKRLRLLPFALPAKAR